MAETAVAPTKSDAARRRPSGIRRTNARRFLIAVGVATGAVGLVGCGDSRTEAPRTIAVLREPAQATPRAGPKRRAAKRATPTIRSCDPNIRVRATTTSCPFAENVFYSYWLNEQEPGVFADSPGLPAYSPARGRMFYVDCTGIDMVTCRDGGVYVTFPASAVSRYTTAAALRYAATAELGEVPAPESGSVSAAPDNAHVSSDCDPSYEGACLDASSSDYDCAGGSGNGPDYTGRVAVVGDDHFGLDRDGDGLGCE